MLTGEKLTSLLRCGTIFITEFCLLYVCSNVIVSEVSVSMKMLAGLQADFFLFFD